MSHGRADGKGPRIFDHPRLRVQALPGLSAVGAAGVSRGFRSPVGVTVGCRSCPA